MNTIKAAAALLAILRDFDMVMKEYARIRNHRLENGAVGYKPGFRGVCLYCEYGHFFHNNPHPFWPAFWECCQKHGIDRQTIQAKIRATTTRASDSCSGYGSDYILNLVAEQLDTAWQQRPDQP